MRYPNIFLRILLPLQRDSLRSQNTIILLVMGFRFSKARLTLGHYILK